MNPLDVATDGWLSGPTSIASGGYLSIVLPSNVSILDIDMISAPEYLVLVEVGEEVSLSFDIGDHNIVDIESAKLVAIEFISRELEVEFMGYEKECMVFENIINQ